MRSRAMQHRARRERGFALPMVILVIAVLAVLIAAGVTALGSERRVSDDTEAHAVAFTLAQAGMERFLADRDASFSPPGFANAPPKVAESQSYTFAGGQVDVVMRPVRIDETAERYTYVLQSHAVSTSAQLQGTTQAERTVAQYVVWRPMKINVLSSWTSLSGIKKQGTANMGISGGQDVCNPTNVIAGVAVANPGFTAPAGYKPNGNPQVQDLGPNPGAADAVDIDWAGIVNGSVLKPDITIPAGGSWPSSYPTGTPVYPIVMVKGNTSLPKDGQGILIVTGDLTLSGSVNWKGLVLVGGVLYSNGNGGVEGATITGLNAKLGMSVSQSDIGNGTKQFNYNSCLLAKALARYGQLVPATNAWVDNWPTY